MTAPILAELEQVFGWLLAASCQASVLAVLILLIQRLLGARLNPRWRYALWLLVLLRLVLPVEPESALSLFQFATPPPPVLTVKVTEPLFVSQPIPTLSSAPADAPEPTRPITFYSLLAVIWLTGAMVLLVLTRQVNRRFARQIANSPVMTDLDLLKLFAEAKAELGIRRVIRLIESSQVQSPAIMGPFKPTLLLPVDVRARFDLTELRLIFLHELAHLKRGDVIVQALITLLQILHWFNPVLWFAFRRMRIDREPATDALVLSHTGEAEKEHYGLMLIKLLEHFSQRHSLPILVGILEDKDQFKRRFSLIARFTRGAYGWSLLGVLLIGVLAVACLTKGKASDDAPGPTQPTTDQRFDELHNNLRIKIPLVKDMPLDQFIEMLRQQLQAQDPQKEGLSFVLRLPPGETPIRVSLDYTKIPGYRASAHMVLEELKRLYPIRYKEDDSSVIYVLQLSKAEIEFHKKAEETKISLDFDHTEASAALLFWRQIRARSRLLKVRISPLIAYTFFAVLKCGRLRWTNLQFCNGFILPLIARPERSSIVGQSFRFPDCGSDRSHIAVFCSCVDHRENNHTMGKEVSDGISPNRGKAKSGYRRYSQESPSSSVGQSKKQVERQAALPKTYG